MTRERGEQDERERLESVIRGLGTLGYTREAHDIAALIYRATSAEADRARLLAENARLETCEHNAVQVIRTVSLLKDHETERADAAEARVQALAAENAALREAHLYLLTGWREEAACLRRDGRVIRAEATEKCADQLRAALAPSQGASNG